MKTVLAIYLLLVPLTKDYKQYFNDGLAAYNKENYGAAIEGFSQSYALQKHSKTSYYIGLCYFKLGKDSLAQSFASRAQLESPKLPDNPYQENIERIKEIYQLSPRFKGISFKVEQSVDEIRPSSTRQTQDEILLHAYYSNSPEGQVRELNDFFLVTNRTLPHENELKLNRRTLQLNRDPIVDNLDH